MKLKPISPTFGVWLLSQYDSLRVRTRDEPWAQFLKAKGPVPIGPALGVP